MNAITIDRQTARAIGQIVEFPESIGQLPREVQQRLAEKPVETMGRLRYANYLLGPVFISRHAFKIHNIASLLETEEEKSLFSKLLSEGLRFDFDDELLMIGMFPLHHFVNQPCYFSDIERFVQRIKIGNFVGSPFHTSLAMVLPMVIPGETNEASIIFTEAITGRRFVGDVNYLCFKEGSLQIKSAMSRQFHPKEKVLFLFKKE